MATSSTQYVPVDDGATDLAAIFGEIKAAASKIGPAIQSISNDWAALEAQNRDIAGGRWTLNNAVYQFNTLSPAAQAALIFGAVYLVAHFVKA